MRYFFLIIFSSCCWLSQAQQLSDFKIAYNVYYDTLTRDYEIYIMDTDGSNKKNITNSKGIDWLYYAYGDKLYFASDRDTTAGKYQLYEMDADGNNVRRIAAYLIDDSFLDSRKNGRELLITSRKEGKKAFYIIDLQGNVISKIIPSGLESFNDPMFLPGGEQIVFRGARQSAFKTRKRNDPVSNDELYVMNDDGSALRQLTVYPPNDSTPDWHSYHAGPPRWNPSDRFVSYVSFQNGRHAIYGIDPKTSVSFTVLDRKLEPGWHDWFMDGRWLVADVSSKGGFDIYLMNYTTNEVIRLTDDWRYEQAPVFVKRKQK